MATAGKVAPTPKDKFVNGTAYDKLDVVEYNGTLYIAKKASAGVLPTDTEYWMLAVDLTGKLDTTGDTENNTVTFESSDEADPTAWKNVNVLSSKEKHSSLLKKISTMFSNVRYLYKLLGTTDISSLGTVTQALANLDGNVGDIKGIISSLEDCSAATVAGYAADALAVKELSSNLNAMAPSNSTQLGILVSNDSLSIDPSQYKFVYFLFNGAYGTDIFSVSAINKHHGARKTYTITNGYSFSIDPYIDSNNQLSVGLEMTGYTSGGVSVHAIK